MWFQRVATNYVLEQNKKNRYASVNPCFNYLKVGLNGHYISLTCYPDVKNTCTCMLPLLYIFTLKAAVINDKDYSLQMYSYNGELHQCICVCMNIFVSP